MNEKYKRNLKKSLNNFQKRYYSMDDDQPGHWASGEDFYGSGSGTGSVPSSRSETHVFDDIRPHVQATSVRDLDYDRRSQTEVAKLQETQFLQDHFPYIDNVSDPEKTIRDLDSKYKKYQRTYPSEKKKPFEAFKRYHYETYFDHPDSGKEHRRPKRRKTGLPLGYDLSSLPEKAPPPPYQEYYDAYHRHRQVQREKREGERAAADAITEQTLNDRYNRNPEEWAKHADPKIVGRIFGRPDTKSGTGSGPRTSFPPGKRLVYGKVADLKTEPIQLKVPEDARKREKSFVKDKPSRTRQLSRDEVPPLSSRQLMKAVGGREQMKELGLNWRPDSIINL